jgi:hypothetical protein
MAIALGIGFLCAGRHPGGTAHTEKTPQEPLARRSERGAERRAER